MAVVRSGLRMLLNRAEVFFFFLGEVNKKFNKKNETRSDERSNIRRHRSVTFSGYEFL